MAIVILGGLLSATALNMLVLPALYTLYSGVAVIAAERAEENTGAPMLEPTLG